MKPKNNVLKTCDSAPISFILENETTFDILPTQNNLESTNRSKTFLPFEKELSIEKENEDEDNFENHCLKASERIIHQSLEKEKRRHLFEQVYIHSPPHVQNLPLQTRDRKFSDLNAIDLNIEKSVDSKIKLLPFESRNMTHRGSIGSFYSKPKEHFPFASQFKKHTMMNERKVSDADDNNSLPMMKSVSLKNLYHSPTHSIPKLEALSKSRSPEYSDFKSVKEPIATGEESLRKLYPKVKYLLFPDEIFKKTWNIIITIFLLFTAVVTPYRISFYDQDDTFWSAVDWIVIIIFTFDIIVNFFSTYFDENDDLVTNPRQIAMNYLKSWLIIDVISVIPISVLIEESDVTYITRLAKLPRLYRLIKMTKLLRMLKIVKERGKFATYLKKLFKISSGIERLLYFAFIFFLLSHICACMWYFIAKIDGFGPSTWVVKGNFYDMSNVDIYVASFYYTITTVTTVGYGDITAGTTNEKILSITIMFIGVMAYTFAIGSLSSVLSSLDSKKAKFKEKLETLAELRKEYNLSHEMYFKLKKLLKYDHSRDETEKVKFVNELPHSLQVELGFVMHQKIIEKVSFFQQRDPRFIAFIGNLLHPIKVFEGEYIYEENDQNDGIYFLAKGEAGLVLPEYGNQVYVTIPEGLYFGDFDIYGENSEKRAFTVQATTDCEILFINTQDLAKLYEKFPEIIDELILNGEIRYNRCSIEKKKTLHFERKISMKRDIPKIIEVKDENIIPIQEVDEKNETQEKFILDESHHSPVRKNLLRPVSGSFSNDKIQKLVGKTDSQENIYKKMREKRNSWYMDINPMKLEKLEENDQSSKRNLKIDTNLLQQISSPPSKISTPYESPKNL